MHTHLSSEEISRITARRISLEMETKNSIKVETSCDDTGIFAATQRILQELPITVPSIIMTPGLFPIMELPTELRLKVPYPKNKTRRRTPEGRYCYRNANYVSDSQSPLKLRRRAHHNRLNSKGGLYSERGFRSWAWPPISRHPANLQAHQRRRNTYSLWSKQLHRLSPYVPLLVSYAFPFEIQITRTKWETLIPHEALRLREAPFELYTVKQLDAALIVIQHPNRSNVMSDWQPKQKAIKRFDW
jgi:hypothetical protein